MSKSYRQLSGPIRDIGGILGADSGRCSVEAVNDQTSVLDVQLSR